jgi:very-short-patch-repair endonuclease
VLRSSQLGVRFRRQVVLCGYIVDFCAPSADLVVEVDGGYHALRRRADARRDEKLRRAGYRVLRVSAEMVRRDLQAVLAAVEAVLAEHR